MEEHLNGSDRRLLLGCLLVALLSLGVGIPNFYRAFPEAAIDFAITREEAGARAAAFLEARGLAPAGYGHSAAFRYDNEAKTFLERELGLAGASALIGQPVRLWRWSNRWTRPLQKEELQVELTTTGELVGFAHLIEEERPGARLAPEQARELAEAFLGSLGRDPLALEFVDYQALDRPARTDYTFTWKVAGFEVHEATYRLRVGVQGDEVASYAEGLKVPEAWQRDYQKLRSTNEATGMVAGLLLVLTWVALLASLVASARRQEVRWKPALGFGGIALVLSFLSGLNELPVSIHDTYQTTDTLASFLGQAVLRALLSALGTGLFITFIVAGAEPVYRRAYGHHLDLFAQFRPAGLRSKRFLLGSALGLALTAFFFAYQTLFYLGAERFGAWSPAEIPYSEMVNTYFPWITVLFIGFLPAVMEEFTSRAFSIPFLEGLIKRRWLALVVAAFVWGFAHANYPQQPFYIRGLEVGIGGLLVGAVMLRWGLFPALAWHYTVDALYTALVLLRSSNPYYVFTAALGAGLLLIPLLGAGFLYWRRGCFVDPTPLLNRASAPPPLPLSPAHPAARRDLSPLGALPRRHILGAAGVLALGALLFAVEVDRPLPFLGLAVDRSEAAQRSRLLLAAEGVDLAGYEQVTFCREQVDEDAMRYLLQHEGLEGLNRLYREDLQALLWQSRFYCPLQKEEYLVALAPDGARRSLQHEVAEESPGADLGQEEARQVAEKYLHKCGIDPAGLELKEAASERMAERRDHRLVWEAPPGDGRNSGDARFRYEVTVSGDEATSLLRYLKLPEAWLRERRESTALRTALQGLLAAVVVAALLHLLWLLIRQCRRGGLDWHLLLRAGAAAGALFLLGRLNALPTFYEHYDTSLNPAVYTLTQGVGWALGALFIGLLVAGCLAMAETLRPGSLEYLRPRSWRGSWGQALLRAGLAGLGLLETEVLVAWLEARHATQVLTPSLRLPPGPDTWMPGLQVLLGALASALLLPLVLVVAGFYYRRLGGRRLAAAVPAALLALTAAAQAVSPGEFWLAFATASLRALVWALLLGTLLRHHPPACALTGLLSSIIPGSIALCSQKAIWYELNGALALLAALVLLAAWWRAQRHSPSPVEARL